MVPYLGFGRYNDLLSLTKRYHQIQNTVGKKNDDEELFRIEDNLDKNIATGEEADKQ